MDYEVRKCKGKAALNSNLRKNVKIDLLSKAKFFKCLVETSPMLIVDYKGMMINIYENGKIRIPTLDENKARDTADELYKVLL